MADAVSELQFTSAYRGSFQFSRKVRENLASGSFAASTSGVTVTDLDGNQLFDLGGSYDVNIFG